MADPFDVRGSFPLLGDITYLNTASMGLVPDSVIHRAQEFDSDLASRGTTGFDEEAETSVLEAARTAGARLLNAPPDNVAIATSFTEALCQLAWWLRPGAPQNVVSTDVDFPSVTYVWHRLAEDTGLEVRLVPVLDDPRGFDIDRVATFVDDATAAISISHVQYLTGHRLDLRALAELAHAHDAILIVDATQSAGQVPIDVDASDVDALITGSYKWLCSTFGSAVCYVSSPLLERFRPPFVGWRSTTTPYDLDARWKELAPAARRMEFSTMSYTAAIALGAAITYILDLGPESILRHNLRLSTMLIDGLEELGAIVLTPREEGRRAGTVSARFPGRDGEEVAAELTRRGVVVSPRVGSTRFSAHFYNTEEDVNRALETLGLVLNEHEGLERRGTSARMAGRRGAGANGGPERASRDL